MSTSTRIVRPLIAAAAVLAIAAPAAQARPFAESVSGAGTTTAQRPTVIVRTTADNGFNWTDASLGAASGLAAGIVALGGALAVRGRRRVAIFS